MKRFSRVGPDNLDDIQSLAIHAGFDAIVLANLLRINIRTLERRCKKLAGCTPRAALENIRLRIAHQLVKQGLTTKEIAFAIGYRRVSHLCDRIKAVYGFTLKELKTLPVAASSEPIRALAMIVVKTESSALATPKVDLRKPQSDLIRQLGQIQGTI